jgi:chitodextrinase
MPHLRDRRPAEPSAPTGSPKLPRPRLLLGGVLVAVALVMTLTATAAPAPDQEAAPPTAASSQSAKASPKLARNSATAHAKRVRASAGSRVAPSGTSRRDRRPPTVPTGLAVSGATATSVSLSWFASTDNVAVAGYGVYLGGGRKATTSTTSYTLAGLACGTSYSVGVNAFDTSGNTSAQATAVVATSACYDATPPSAPSGLVQSAKTDTSATVAWHPATDNVGVVGYGLYRSSVRVGQTAQTSYTFAGLACGTTTAVAVDAYDAAGNHSGQTAFVVSTSACVDGQAPTAPSGLASSAATETSVTASWKASTDNVAVAGYGVTLNGTPVTSTPQTQYVLGGLTCATTYTVGVYAFDAAGNKSSTTTASLSTAACPPPPPPPSSDTSPPTSVHNVVVTAADQTSVTLGWMAATDNVGVTGYDGYKNGVRDGQTAQLTYSFVGLQCGTSYTLAIDAYDAAGNRGPQYSVIASTSACPDSQAPTQPSNLTLSGRTSTSLSLTWAAATDNVGVVGYGVYKAGVRVGTTSPASYTVTGLACGTSYTIGVDAYDAAGNRSGQASVLTSTSACGDTQAPTAPSGLAVSAPSQSGITLSWSAATDNVGVAGYDVFANGTKSGTASGTSYQFSGLACGTTYTLGVEAFDGAGNRSTRSTVSGSTAACPPPPSGGASVFISPSGNDGNSCVQAAPCKTFDRAYRVAQPGAVVQVAGGLYPETDPAAGTIRIDNDSSKTTSTDVVFQCTSGQDVTFDAENFTIIAKHITFQGSCFKFRKIWTGQGGDTTPDSDDLTFDGVKMAGFQIVGSTNVTIKNSEIGPQVACYRNGDTSKASSSWCQNNASTGEDWYYRRGLANAGIEESKIQANSGGYGSSNIVLAGNWIHDQQTRASDTNVAGSDALHMGGLLIEEACTCAILLDGNKFERNVTYDIQGDPSPHGVTVQNNWFGVPYNTLDQGASPIGGFKAIDLTLRSNGQNSLGDWLIRFNSIETGLRIGDGSSGQTYSNVRVIGNIWGAGQQCLAGVSGLKYDFNAPVGSTCGTNSQSLPSLPYASTGTSIDFHLTGGNAVDMVKTADDDAQLASDFDNKSRPQGAGRDAGADELR